MRRALALLVTSTAILGCGAGDTSSTSPSIDAAAPIDAAREDSTALPDVGADTSRDGAAIDGSDDGLAAVAEMEPNDGKTETEVNAFSIPGNMTGAIDPADDLDILSLSLQAGDVWTYSLTGGAALSPHLGISEKGNKAPTMVASAAAGAVAEQEHFVLTTNTYFAIVRDARNVPAASSKHVGGPTFTWRLSARKTPKTPEAVTFPKTVTGKLANTTSIALYSFKGAKDFGFDVVLKAERKSPPSSLDSRMSLYETTTKAWILTNDDDAAAKTRDSHIGGLLPLTGDYVIVVENVAPAATDLSYELSFTPR